MSIIAVVFIFTIVHTSHSSARNGYSALALDLSGARAFCINEEHEGLDVLDIKTGAVTNTLLLDKDISAIAMDEQRRIAAVTGEKNLYIVSLDTLETLQNIKITHGPTSIAIDSNAGQAVVTHKQGAVSIIDLTTYTTITTIDVLKKPVSVAVDPGLRIAVLAHESNAEDDEHDEHDGHDRGAHGHGNNSSDNITILDLTTLSIAKTLQAGKSPVQIAINASTHQAAVANEKNDTITIIDLATRLVTGTFPEQKHPKALMYNDCLNTLAVIGGEDKAWLQVMDESTGAIQASFDYGNKQENLALSSSLNQAYLVGRNGLTIQDLPNPVPELVALSPNKAMRGGSAFSLTIEGKGLMGTTELYLNADKTETTSASCNSVKVEVPSAYLQAAGQIEIKAVNPTPEGGASSVLTLAVENPAPVITALQPSQETAGASDMTLTIIGTGFFSDTVLYVNNVQRLFTLISPTQLQTTLLASDLENGGYLDINAANSLPGGGLSITAQFTVKNPVPSLSSLDPSTMKANSADTALVLTGDNFVKSTTVYVNGQPYATQFVNKTRIETTIPASFLAAAGSYPVNVISPGPGGGETQPLTLTVSQPGSTTVEPLTEGSFGKQYEELIPLDATIAAYTAKRFAIVTGLVKDRDQNPVSYVKVSFLGLPEYGTAQTDAEGRYSIPVDGGGALTMVFEKTGLITSHRQVNTPWNDIINTETITMLSEDTKATTLTFDGNPATVLVHTSSVVTDDRGPRSLTMVFTGDNRATVTDEKGNQTVMTTITTRATEFDTPESMPAKLPATSAYTYCSELSVDGGKNVTFEKPVTMYVDNFLGFNVGEIVPVGYYDRNKGAWMASDNGVVARLLDTNGDGIVDALDTVGDGQPHDTNVAGLTDPTKFKPNATYWQVQISHFTPWDLNWSYGPPPDAIQPNPNGVPDVDQQQDDDDVDCTGSYCERRTRIIHEDVPILGTDMTLHYASNRVSGYKTAVTIPASGTTVPTSLMTIFVRMEISGRVFESSLPPSPNQKVEFVWDGLDYLGNPVSGSATAKISIGFSYLAVYYLSPRNVRRAWEQVGNNATGIRSRQEVTTWKQSVMTLQGNGADSFTTGFGNGWTLSSHHYLNPTGANTIYKGNGTKKENGSMIITTIAGTGIVGFGGDGNLATEARLDYPTGVAVDSAGNVYIADQWNSRIRRVDTGGVITTIAGDGYGYYAGDDVPATETSLGYPFGVAVDSVGNTYIADLVNNRIRKVDTAGIITTVAGSESYDYSDFIGDGGPATQAILWSPLSIAVDGSNNIYIADLGNNRIRKVDSSGVISTVAGNGAYGFSGDGGPATEAMLNEPCGVSIDGAGNIYISDTGNYRIRKVDTSGVISTIAGNGSNGFSGDGGPAVQAGLEYVYGTAVDSVGNIYISAPYSSRIRKINAMGTITTVAGSGEQGSTGDGGLATDALLHYPFGVAVDSGGNIYIADADNNRIRKVALPSIFVQAGATGDIPVADNNGLGYIMSSTGLHKSTIDLATNKTLLTFGYNADNKLISITDRFGSQTTIQRNSAGHPTVITSPDGHVIGLTIDGNNNLERVAYPDGSSYSFGYTTDGLMTDEYDRRGNLFVHQYNSNGKITKVSDPEGGSWSYSRASDNAGNVLSNVLTAENNLFAYQDRTDSTGAYTSIKTDPTGEVITLSRSADGLTETTASSCGMKQSRQYDRDSEYKFTYITAATTATPAGLKLTSAYSRTYKDTNSDKVPDLITDLASKNSRTWTTTNNTLTGVVTATSPKGRTTTSQYEPATLLTQQITATGLYPIAFSYDTRGRLVSTSTGSRTTTMAYDTNGYYDYIITPDNRKVDYTYDVMGKLHSLQRPDGSLIQYDYDLNGSMTVLTNPMSVTNTFGYTANKQRNIWTTPLSGSYQYGYDKERKLKTITFPSGKVISNTYTHGLLTNTTTSEGVTNYAYSCGSNLASVSRGGEGIAFTYDGSLLKTDTRSGTLNQAISYTYNNDFVLSSITYAGATQSFGYDNDGLFVSTGTYAITRNSQNGLPEVISDSTFKINRAFSGYGEMDENTYSINNTPLYDWTVSRDNAGRITRKTENMQGSAAIWDYGYDEAGRITTVKQNNAVVESYTYDADGNRLTEINDLRLTNKTYTYSAEDHVITAGTDRYLYDQDGFLTSKITSAGTTTFSYSSRGELLNATLPSGTAISYDHDPMGRRIAKRVNGTITEQYLWQGMTRLLAVYDGSNNLVMRFVYAGGRMPVSMAKSNVTYYLAYDQIGSLRAVIDTTGTVTKEVLYDSFGSILYESNTAFSVPFGFAGGLHDKDTGLVRFGFRDYDPNIARWTAKDPIDFAGGDVNLFGYVGNNPINWYDSLGLQAACMTPAGPIPFPILNLPKATPEQQQQAIDTLTNLLNPMPLIDFLLDNIFNKTPNTGEPGTWTTNPGSGQERLYGEDGKPLVDLDYDHGDPHSHNWGRDENGDPTHVGDHNPFSPWPQDRK